MRLVKIYHPNAGTAEVPESTAAVLIRLSGWSRVIPVPTYKPTTLRRFP